MVKELSSYTDIHVSRKGDVTTEITCRIRTDELNQNLEITQRISDAIATEIKKIKEEGRSDVP